MATQFDMRVIPPENRSKTSVAQHMEMWKRKNDIWRVYNPTDQDYTIFFDRRYSNEKYVVPSNEKDIGHGKGCQDVPMYCMELYRDHMGIELLNKRSQDEWDKKKMEFREEDRAAMQEKFALRTDNQEAWDDMVKLLVKGVVKRFRDDADEMDVFDEPKARASSPGEEAMNRLGLDNVVIEDAKEQLIKDLQ